MLQIGPPDFLAKVGRALGEKSRSFILLIALGGLFISTTVGAVIVQKTSFYLAKSMGLKSNGITANNGKVPDTRFYERYQKANGKAYQAFFDLGLSNINFISKYSRIVESSGEKYEFKYLELWVKDNFSFNGALEHFKNLVSQKVRGVALESTKLDAKAFRLIIKLDGIETHKIIFSKTGVETESDAEMPAMVDIAKGVPKIKYSGPAKIVIIIDDIGHRKEVERQFLNIPVNLTFAVMPYSPNGVEFAKMAHDRGHEIMLHLPMEPKAYPKITPGKGGLLLSMTKEKLADMVNSGIVQVPFISGVNNHMGSAFTSSPSKMRQILSLLKPRGLYFVDSRTAGSAIGYETARELGVPATARNVFLDHDPRPSNIARQFDLMVSVALRKGAVVAIGHPHAATLKVLKEKIPSLKTKNVVIVPPSKVVH